MADQFERDNCSNPSSGASDAIERCNRITVIKVSGQHVRDGSERRIRKSSYREQCRDQVEIGSKDSRNEQCDPDASKNYQGLTRSAKCPAAPDQVSRNAASEEVCQISGDERYPHGE